MIDIEKLKEQVRSLSVGSLGSAAQVDSICYALDRLQMKLKEAEQAKQNICSLLDLALAQNEAMKVELVEARRDAERYRWLRECGSAKGVIDWGALEVDYQDPAGMDSAIDAARQQKP